MGFDVRRGRTGEHSRLVRVVSARAHAAADSGTRPASNATGGQRAPPAGVRVGGGAASARPQLPHAHVARGDELAHSSVGGQSAQSVPAAESTCSGVKVINTVELTVWFTAERRLIRLLLTRAANPQ